MSSQPTFRTKPSTAPLGRAGVFRTLVLLTLLSSPRSVLAQDTLAVAGQPASAGTATVWGSVNGVAIEGIVEGPSTEKAPLQVVCVFEYTEGDIFTSPPALPEATNGMRHLDDALGGFITELRRSGKFAGSSLETLLIVPPRGTIPAAKVLLIGLGDRRTFSPDLMIAVGRVAMREALRERVKHYAFASDLKDAGIDSPTALVATNVLLGAFDAYRTKRVLEAKHMGEAPRLAKLTMLAGPAFFTTAGEGIKTAITTLRGVEK